MEKCQYNDEIECTWVPDHAENCVGGACRDYRFPPRDPTGKMVEIKPGPKKRMDDYPNRNYCSSRLCDSAICVGSKCFHYIEWDDRD